MKKLIALITLTAPLLVAQDAGIITLPTPIVEPAKPAVTYDREFMTLMTIKCADGTNATAACVLAPKSSTTGKLNTDESTHRRVVIPDALGMCEKVPQLAIAVGALVEAVKAYEASNMLWAVESSNAVWLAEQAAKTNAPANP